MTAPLFQWQLRHRASFGPRLWHFLGNMRCLGSRRLIWIYCTDCLFQFRWGVQPLSWKCWTFHNLRTTLCSVFELYYNGTYHNNDDNFKCKIMSVHHVLTNNNVCTYNDYKVFYRRTNCFSVFWIYIPVWKISKLSTISNKSVSL